MIKIETLESQLFGLVKSRIFGNQFLHQFAWLIFLKQNWQHLVDFVWNYVSFRILGLVPFQLFFSLLFERHFGDFLFSSSLWDRWFFFMVFFIILAFWCFFWTLYLLLFDWIIFESITFRIGMRVFVLKLETPRRKGIVVLLQDEVSAVGRLGIVILVER